MHISTHIKHLCLALGCIITLSVAAGPFVRGVQTEKPRVVKEEEDTVPKSRYSVSKTSVQNMEDETHAADLKTPENLKTEVHYDEPSGTYRYGTKLGEEWLEAPFFMSGEEYARWQSARILSKFYKDKNKKLYEEKGREKFDFMHFSILASGG